MRELIGEADDVFASPLLEAEFRAALVREGVDLNLTPLESIRWVLPDRTLSAELGRVFEAGHVRGPDAWHVATALFLLPTSSELPFLTLDQRQRAIAQTLGFPTP